MNNYELLVNKREWEQPERYFILEGIGIIYDNPNKGLEKLSEFVEQSWSFLDKGLVRLKKLDDKLVRSIIERLVEN